MSKTGCLLCAIVVAAVSCKRTVDVAEVMAGPENQAGGAEVSLQNLTAEGGLKGTSDQCSALPAEYPRFEINGGEMSYPATVDPAEQLRLKNAGIADEAAIDAMVTSKGNNSDPVEPRSRELALKWLDAVQKYIYAGMNDQDLTKPDANFRLSGAMKGRWYHMPWLHTPIMEDQKLPGRGRECIWGLTREVDLMGPIDPKLYPLITGDKIIGQNWGSAFYNPIAATAIAKVFPAGTKVNLNTPDVEWPIGSLIFKMLFTSATAENAESPLVGAWTIHASINKGGARIGFNDTDQTRIVTPMAHVQMDIMYKYGPKYTDWLFGTYAYSKEDASRNDASKHWQGMRPIGVQWGISPETSITLYSDFQPNGFYNEAKDSSLPVENPHQRRMNGPADNPAASCYQCHARAQWPAAPSARLPFAPKDKGMIHQVQLLHYWQGEVVALKKCKELVAAGAKFDGRPLTCPQVAGCTDVDSSHCIPAGVPPVIPGGVRLGFSAQMQLALENIAQLQNNLSNGSDHAGGHQ